MSAYRGMFVTRQRNAKPGRICADCKVEIPVGESYVRLALPAWLDCEMDVDDEGRTIGVELPREERKWWVQDLHGPCEDRRWAAENGYDVDPSELKDAAWQ